ncbi:hypothetical protein [Halobacillus sp. A5]|uniref:hypothetical protein n=1 Tax=Halobacillus sp. A5 TaxID=2880263 RepID=UPI0020A67777|nr:hypothetical protein [Halobacillus sp. A5]MCP3029090.1 hypothetical protein [Halobacillus sp. A5]
MTKHHEQDQKLLVKHLIRQFMRDQLKDLKENKKSRNNSFVFLENNTLNMLIIHLLMNFEKQTPEVRGEGDGLDSTKWIEELNQVIKQSEEEFTEVISLLKEKV